MRVKIENPFDLKLGDAITFALSEVILPTDYIAISVGNEDYIRATKDKTVLKIKYTKFLLDQKKEYMVLLFQMAREEILKDFNTIDDDFVRYVVDEYYAVRNLKFDLYPFAYRMALEDVYSLLDYMKVRIIADYIDEKDRIMAVLKRKDKYEEKAKKILSYLPNKIEMLLKDVKDLKIR